MQNVPKIVVGRLRAGPSEIQYSDAQHPDADMLTAFAERSLPVRERATVVDHLAQCHACRDIVMLALPVVDSAQGDAQIVLRPSRAGWLTWPALRWGLAAAGIVVVASLGILRQEHRTQTVAMVAQKVAQKNESLVSEPQQQLRSPDATALPAPVPPKTAGSNKAAASATAPASSVAETVSPRTSNAKSEPELMARATPSPAVHMPGRRAFVGGPHANVISNGQNISAQQQQAAAQVQQNAAAMNIPHASEAVEVSNASPLVQTENAQVGNAQSASSQTLDGLQAQNQPAPPPGASSDSLFDNSPGLVRAKPAIRAEFGPQWVVTATGGLQRSFDQGNSWQDVNVTANLFLPENGRIVNQLIALAPAKENQTKDNQAKADQQDLAKQSAAQPGLHKKSATAAPAAPVFRTVAANGGDVWAGGSNAALYHSTDAGNHWTQVVPSAAGAALTGDVVRVEFTDAPHGKVTTSTSETWITSDGGQIWQKQ
jgi:Photosynthesis system II assembly factor YCF48